MIRINLIPFRAARKKENVRQQVTVFLLLLVLVGMGLAWYNANLNKKIVALNSQIDYTQKEIVRFNKIAKEVDELRNKLAVLKRKLEVIESLERNRGAAFNLLDSLNDLLIPRRMWFTRLEAIQQEIRQREQPGPARRSGKRGAQAEEPEEEATVVPAPNIDIKVEGVALDNKTVADFMTRLESSDLYIDVRLILLQQEMLQPATGDPIQLKKFEIACKKPPAQSLLVSQAEEP